MSAEPTLYAVGLGSEARTAALHGAVVASLPARFAPAVGDPATVVVVATVTRDWPTRVRAAVDAGAAGILVAGTGPADPVAIREAAAIADGAGVAAVADAGFALDPGWTRALEELRRDAGTAALLDSVVTVAEADAVGVSAEDVLLAAAIGQVAVVRKVLGGLDRLVASTGAGKYAAHGATGPVIVVLAGVLVSAPADGLRLDLVGRDARWEVRFPGEGLAKPARIARQSADGTAELPPVFESGHRRAWIALHDALGGTSAPAYSLADLANDTEIATAALHGGGWTVTPTAS
jgi:hypothetical protein